MAAVEVDEGELATLRNAAIQGQNYEKLVKGIAGNPKTRTKYLELIKELSPNTPIPEIDAKREGLEAMKPVVEGLETLRKGFEEFKAAEEKKSGAQQTEKFIEQGRSFLRSRHYQDDGIAAIEKLMQERGITDYHAAEALFRDLQPPEEPVVPGSTRTWDMFPSADDDKEKDTRELFMNPNKWVRKNVPKILQEERSRMVGGRR